MAPRASRATTRIAIRFSFLLTQFQIRLDDFAAETVTSAPIRHVIFPNCHNFF